MPDLTINKSSGGTGGSLTLQDTVFGGDVNQALLHQAVVRQQADRRQGTHDTQTRAEVSRTTKKVWRQKGTGRARQGSRKGPHWTGGGVAFGPHPRSHRLDLPKKMRVAAIRSALAAKTGAGELVLIDGLNMQAPNTKQLAQLLGGLEGGGSGASTLLLLDRSLPNVQLSARNLPRVTTATVDNINAYDLMRHKRVVMTVTAARRIEARFGEGDESAVEVAEVTPLPAIEKRAPIAAVKTAAKKTAAKKTATKSAAKATSKSAEPETDESAEETVEETPAPAPATKTARKRATKSASKSAESEE